MIYVDANPFIFALTGSGAMKEKASTALASARQAGAMTSSLTVDEVVWGLRHAGKGFAIEQGRRLLSLPGLQVVPVTSADVRRGLDLMDRHGLDPRDAIHAAVALAAQAEMLSFDSDFDQVPGLRRVRL